MEIYYKKDFFFRKIREFFYNKKYLEMHPAVFSSKIIPESNIKLFETEYNSEFVKSQYFKLLPSPEYYVKLLLSTKIKDNVFTLCKAFRNQEVLSNQHLLEFTMLEYYTQGFDYLDTLKLTEEMFLHLQNSGFENPKMTPPFLKLKFEDLFLEYLNINLKNAEVKELEYKAKELGIEIPKNNDYESIFNILFFSKIQNKLPQDRLYVLIDYPCQLNTLAKNDGFTSERWELYFNNIELSNCFSEETSSEKIKKFFEEEIKKLSPKELSFVDREYPNTLNLPKCSGNAMGIERLMMVFFGINNIQEVI